jgi:hypothetical protein
LVAASLLQSREAFAAPKRRVFVILITHSDKQMTIKDLIPTSHSTLGNAAAAAKKSEVQKNAQ